MEVDVQRLTAQVDCLNRGVSRHFSKVVSKRGVPFQGRRFLSVR
jgi:hypothetical protein